MANGRRPIPPLRAYTAAVLGVFALFVISAGGGMTSWSIVVLGVALMILAVSLVVVSAMRGGARAYVAGTAHVVSASEPPASSMYGRCELHLVVDAPGMAAAAVKIRDPRVPVAKWPDAGTTLPIMVAVDDPRRVRIQWDDVPTHAETAADDQLLDEYGEEYAPDYSEEYPEYVPPRDPMQVPPERPSPDLDEGATADLGGDLADLLDMPISPAGPAADRPGRAADAAAPAPDEPAPAAERRPPATEEAATATAETRHGRPPAPRRPEASPEAPDEVYPVAGEPVFSPKVPPGPEPADLAGAPSGAAVPPPGAAKPAASGRASSEPAPGSRGSSGPAAGSQGHSGPAGGAGSSPGTGGGARPEPTTPEAAGSPPRTSGPPRPRPRPRPASKSERASADERPPAGSLAGGASRRGAMTAAAQTAGATAAATAATGTVLTDPEPGQAAPDRAEPAGSPRQSEETAEGRSGPSVTAIEFDLGELITSYPSARPGPAGAIHGVGITVLVRDLARSTEFYRDVLGFYEIDGGEGNVVLASGDTRLVLRAVHDAPPVDRRLVHVNLEVADVQAVYEELRAKGVRFTYPPRPTSRGERLELWAAAFRDPDGHGIAITQWRSRSH